MMMESMLEQFRNFAASKPADEGYDWCDLGNCAVAQFADQRPEGYPNDGSFLELQGIACDEPNTFGALTERLNKALATPLEG